jgi:hypothetical protein
MAIKITKPGQKEFHAFCKWCGCEFTYEISDIKLSATSDKVSCPTCGKDYHHNMMVQDPTIPGGIGRLQTWPPEPIPCTPDMTKTDPCAGCVWRENLLRDGIYIGDTPCTWCNKNQFNKITCVQPGIKDYTTPCINELDTQLTTSTSSELSGIKYSLRGDKISSDYQTDINAVDGRFTTTICGFKDAQADEDITQGTVMQTILNACGCNCGDTEGKATETATEATQANCTHTSCQGKKNCKGKH